MNRAEEPPLTEPTRFDSCRIVLERALAPALRGLDPRADGVKVPAARVCPLAEFPQGSVLVDLDMRATVLLPVRGGLSALAALSFAPEGAMTLIRRWAGPPGPGPDGRDAGRHSLECFLDGGQHLLAAALIAFGLDPAPASEARLEEDALLVSLARTHAPADTAVWSAEVVITCNGSPVPAVFALMADPKALGALVAGL